MLQKVHGLLFNGVSHGFGIMIGDISVVQVESS